MEIANNLYQLSARDVQSPLLEPFALRNEAGVAGLTVTTEIFRVPDDRSLHVDCFGLEFAAGAAQTWLAGAIKMQPKGALFAVNLLAHNSTVLAGIGTRVNFARSMNIILPPGSILFSYGLFNGAVNANAVVGEIQGWLIPRGNLGSV